MNAIEQLSEINFTSWIIACFMILSVIIAMYEIIAKFAFILGKPIGKFKEREADHKLLLKTVEDVKDIRKQQRENYEMFTSHERELIAKLDKLTKLFVDKQIDDMRYEILDFASSISSGMKHNRESFDHIFKVHQKYENILEENGMENGLVAESMEYISEIYHEQLKDGTIK